MYWRLVSIHLPHYWRKCMNIVLCFIRYKIYIPKQFLHNAFHLWDLNARKQWNRVHIYRQFLPAMSILFTQVFLVSPICWLVLSTAIYVTPINFSLQQNKSHFPNWICVVLSLLENWLCWFRVRYMQTWKIFKLRWFIHKYSRSANR